MHDCANVILLPDMSLKMKMLTSLVVKAYGLYHGTAIDSTGRLLDVRGSAEQAQKLPKDGFAMVTNYSVQVTEDAVNLRLQPQSMVHFVILSFGDD